MRIVIDLQGAQTESRFRGIGRYSMSLTKEIVKNRGEHEIVIALNSLFPETIEPIRAEFRGLLPQENIRVCYAPGSVQECEPGNEWRRQAAERIREAFLAMLKPDIIFITSLFEGFIDDGVTSICIFDKTTPVFVILYDLIPLLNPKQYLKSNPAYKKHYLNKIEHLKKAKGWLCISNATAREAQEFLGNDKKYTVNISTACDNKFRKIEISQEEEEALRNRYHLNQPFILYTGSSDFRKNLHGLIRAYANLSPELRDKHQFVLAGKMGEGDIYGLKKTAKVNGLFKDQLIFTGYVKDEELVQLYNLCKLFVFPSLHEGFGLPALEAMSCGTPTIGSNCTSIPEVISRKDALFDPNNVESIAALIEMALTDEGYRQSLKKHGLERAKKVSWDKSAKRAIEAMEQHFDNSEGNPDNSHVEDSTEVFYNDLISELADIVHDKKNIEDHELKVIAISIDKNITSVSRVNRFKELKDKLTWRIEGPFDSSYSLALLNRETARALDKLGHHVILHSTEGPGDFLPKQEFLDDNLDLNEMYLRCSSMPHEQCDVVSRNLYPPRVGDMNGNMNILHHYAWEESAFPQDWVDSFNNYLHGMTCLSKHVEKVMIDNGVSIPLSTSGCGVDHWERIEPEKNWKTPGKKFKFLHVSSCFPRKGADVMLKAYGKAFTNSDDISLIIKTFQNPHNEIHKWLREARVAYKNYPHVEIIEKDITDSELKALYTQCDALVAPSRAEGFGLPMAEAMLSGLPVITTGWSGQMHFCNNDTSWLIDYTFAPASTHFNLFDSVWAEPDENHLTELMRQIYNLPLEKRKEKVQKGRELLLNNFKWSDVAERLVNSVRSFAANPLEPELRIGWITTWNTRCGIATYSAHLIDNMDYPVTAILAAHTNDLTAQDQDNVERCWKADNNDSLDNLEKTIDYYDLNTLVIQFNYGFFNFEKWSYFIESQINKGRIVVITLHATFDPENDPSKKLEFLREALLKCHRILVHSLKDLNRLKDLGLIDNVALFPHGLIDIAPEEVSWKIPSGRFVMASYGFFLPNKGLLELIEAVSILAKKKIDVHLLMVNAKYPNPISSEIIAEGKRLTSKLGIKDRVTLITDFLPDEISLGYLHKADLILFPYQKTGESSSAAVRSGLASQIPVAVTPLSIFEDVDKAVYKLPGITPEEISKGVIDYIHALKNGDDKVKEIQTIAEEWRESHLYSRIAKRLKRILLALQNEKRVLL